jgi:hypothetical protein
MDGLCFNLTQGMGGGIESLHSNSYICCQRRFIAMLGSGYFQDIPLFLVFVLFCYNIIHYLTCVLT